MAAVCLTLGLSAFAQTYAAHAVKLIVPFPAGSATGVIARLLANEFHAHFGQAFVVDNKTGAPGIIGAKSVAMTAPDGYTLPVVAVLLVAAESLFKKVPYNSNKDFMPVNRLGGTRYNTGLRSCRDRQMGRPRQAGWIAAV